MHFWIVSKRWGDWRLSPYWQGKITNVWGFAKKEKPSSIAGQ
jgi:hypothetical protein